MIPEIIDFTIAGNTVIVLSFRWLVVGYPGIGEKILILNKADAELIRRNKVLYDKCRRSWSHNGMG